MRLVVHPPVDFSDALLRVKLHAADAAVITRLQYVDERVVDPYIRAVPHGIGDFACRICRVVIFSCLLFVIIHIPFPIIQVKGRTGGNRRYQRLVEGIDFLVGIAVSAKCGLHLLQCVAVRTVLHHRQRNLYRQRREADVVVRLRVCCQLVEHVERSLLIGFRQHSHTII